jgi:hypothetical protein
MIIDANGQFDNFLNTLKELCSQDGNVTACKPLTIGGAVFCEAENFSIAAQQQR